MLAAKRCVSRVLTLSSYGIDRLDGVSTMRHVWQLQEVQNKFSEVVEP